MLEIGIDIGGTFTDFALVDHERRTIGTAKTLTTPQDPVIGVLEGLRGLLDRRGLALSSLGRIAHGTTLITNAVLERRGARVGLLTNAGFGDILFIGGTPIVWAGPLSNWVAACDLMLGMDVETVVPGHGPITDKGGIAQVRDYLDYVDREATARQHAGLDAWDAAREIAQQIGADPRFDELGEFGRIAVNVETVYRSLDPTHATPDVVEQFRRMARIEAAAH